MELAKVNQVIEYNESNILNDISIGFKVDILTSKSIFCELKKYLIGCSISDEKCVPSDVVDKAWHLFIIHTKLYMDFCNKYFGKYIHHFACKGELDYENFYKTKELLGN